MKIRIHPLTYIILLSVLLCGYFNYFLIISVILLFHDLGHLILMKVFKIKVLSIDILPFGSVINTNISYNLDSNKLFLISLGGILIQLALYLLFYILLNIGYINNLSYRIFLTYNRLIILFNIIPIIPLDGSKILLSFLERFISYKKALIIINITSIICIIGLLLTNSLSLNIILISIFLFLKTFTNILEHKYIFNRFLLERYLSKKRYKRVKYITNIKNIYKNKYNFINNENEDKFLAKIFDIAGYF